MNATANIRDEDGNVIASNVSGRVTGCEVDEHGVEVTTIEFDDPWFLRLLEYPNPVGVRDFGGHPLKRSHPFPLTDEQIERLPEVPTTYFGEPAEDARTPQDRALPQPSTTPPMWAPNPARSKRDRRSPRRVK